ncbi:ectoine hydroxylase [Streptomyces roseifaciens]|uniref:ectoine hydroxylase n=1 Tax=Streptomyces roseifaciens TaxID=1488406 RepID=UPI000717F9B3|nr:ectoine hydroxylase [Streptomyces roseifaciens]
MTTVTDLYPTRGSAEVVTERSDPVVWPGREVEAAAGPWTAADLATYERDGFLTVDRLITSGEAGTFRAEVERLIHDPALRTDERTVTEPGSDEVRSVFEVHRISDVFARLVRDGRLVDRARRLLGSEVYVHQSRVNVKPGYRGSGFYWHSDFETWHAEDGLPRMRAVSVSIALTGNDVTNGSLMIMPGSHRTFLGCAGATPPDNYKTSLRMQEAGTPSDRALARLVDEHGIRLLTGPAGSATWFDCNCMHGSGSNITPLPRSNVFIVFNSVENAAVEPFAAPARRPEFIAARDFTPVRSSAVTTPRL